MSDVYPIVRYKDSAAGLRWLVEVLGCTEHMVMRNDDGSIGHAELAFGAGYIMSGGSSGEYNDAVGSLGPAEIYVAIDDVQTHYDRVVAAGAEVVMPLKDHGYGIGYTVRDPERNVWSVGNYRPS